MPRALPSLASVQLACDRRQLERRPELLRRKWARMARSPFAFFRGASAAWASLLRAEPALLAGSWGVGALVGDLHLENFGTYRSARGVAFHVNDFDEAFVGPWSFDVLRLLTSVLLARAELRTSGVHILALVEAVLDGHAAGVSGGRVPMPPAIKALVGAAAAASDDRLLSKRLARPGRLERSADKTPEAPPSVAKLVPGVLEQWCASLPAAERPAAPPRLLDVTRWIAGVGSLGAERLLALVAVGPVRTLLEVKEVRGSPFVRRAPDAARLVEVVRHALPEAPLAMGASRLGRLPVIVRPLRAGDEKLDVDELRTDTLDDTSHFLGFLAGEVHRRTATRLRRCSTAERRRLARCAQTLASRHEEAFLQFCVAVAQR